MDDAPVTQLTAAVTVAQGPAENSILLDKYRVETLLGFGGMGLVIKAHHLALDEHVAIKILRDDIELDDENVARFIREAKAVVRLKSEHVARIRDVGTFDDGKPYMVMELLEGLDLGRMLHDQDQLDPLLAVDLVLQACDAIGEAHSIGVVHRDIKPTNLFVARRRDGSPLLKVLDFGISKAPVGMDLSLTQTASVLGTPAYMSPEQMRSARTVDGRTDIWALGTVLYELVEGRLPFDARNFAELCVLVATEPPGPMTLAPQLEEVVHRCLAKNADDRFPTIAELALALAPFATDPERAKRQVTKIHRMLGKEPPDRTDPSSPSFSDIATQSGVYDPRAATIEDSIRNPSGHVWVVLGALVMIGLGIGAGVWVTRGNAAAVDVGPAPDPSISEFAAEDVRGHIEDRAGIPMPPRPVPQAESVGEHTVRHPPPRHHAPRPPDVVQPTAPLPPPPAPRTCDPFDARNRC
ncbi:MAG: Protein kinase [Myxococcales bacterium]|nr:Protein kinase [Myxococcales bacterium]